MDAGPDTANGASAWFMAGNSYTQTEGTQFLQKYTQVTGEPSRHVNPDTADRLGRLGFVRDTKCASLLIELGFITNWTELQDVRTKAVAGVIAGIQNMNAI
jgi:N-acetylmuramoyl-L-alanine amidase